MPPDPLSTAANVVSLAQSGAQALKKTVDYFGSEAPGESDHEHPGFGFWPICFDVSLNVATPAVYVWTLLIGYSDRPIRVVNARITRFHLQTGITLEALPLVQDQETISRDSKQVCFTRPLYDSEARAILAARASIPETGQIEVVATGKIKRRFRTVERPYATSSRHITGWITRP